MLPSNEQKVAVKAMEEILTQALIPLRLNIGIIGKEEPGARPYRWGKGKEEWAPD